MTLDLVSAVSLAGPLLIILAGQAILVVVWARRVVFPLTGRDFEAAVCAGAFCGFAMGATATAIANMQAVTRRYGPAPESFVVVPIVGAFFVDLMNMAVLTFFLFREWFAGSEEERGEACSELVVKKIDALGTGSSMERRSCSPPMKSAP